MTTLWKQETGSIFWLKFERTHGLEFMVGIYETRDARSPVVEVCFLDGGVGLWFAGCNLASPAQALCMQHALAYGNAIAANKHRFQEMLKRGWLERRYPAGTKGTVNPAAETAEKLRQLGWEHGYAVEVIDTIDTYNGKELLLVSWPNNRLYIASEDFTETPAPKEN